jgi:hypothetical protein
MKARMHSSAATFIQAHRAPTANGPIWLVPGASEEVCLFAGNPLENGCEPASQALRHGMTLGVVIDPADPSKRTFVLYGVVPDGQTSVQVRVGSDPAKTIPVRHGAFSVRAREPVVKL